MSANDAKDGNYYESAVSFAKGGSICDTGKLTDDSGREYKTVPTRSNAGTLFMLPLTTQRDGTLERCVYNSLTEMRSQPFTHWFLVTSAEREAYWSRRNEELMDQLTLDASNDSKKSTRLRTQTELLPPPCVSVVTYERLGVLEWFVDTNTISTVVTHNKRTRAASDPTPRKNRKYAGGVQLLNPQNALLVIDEAHGLLPYLRTQPRLAQTLRKFGRVYHFTYNVKLVDVGYLLRTLPVEKESEEHEYIQALPFGDDDAVYARFGKHRHFRTLSQLASQTNGKLIDFATTAVVLANVARVPGLTTVSNKWADALSPAARSSGKSRRGWLRRLRRTAKDATKASTKPAHAPPPVYTDDDVDDAFRRLVAWKEKHSVRRRDTGRTRKPGRGRAHYRKQGGGTRTHRRGASATTRRRRHRHQRGGVDVLTCGVGIMLLSVLESFRPGTAQSLGGEMFNLMGKITSGFFISMGKSIRHTTRELTPYIHTACQWIRRMNRYLLAHFPKSMTQFRGLATYAHRAFQFVGKRVYNIPSRYRGLTLLFVGMVGVLLMVRVIVDCLYPAGKYDGEKLWKPLSEDTGGVCLSTFVFVQDNAKREARFHTGADATNKHHFLRVKTVRHTLPRDKCREALQWTMYCRKSHDPERVHDGLRIGANDTTRISKLKTRIRIHLGKTTTDDGKATTNNRGLIFTHFSDVAEELCTTEGWTHLTAKYLHPQNEILPRHTRMLVLDEATLMKHYRPDSLYDIAHIHFYEPTSYSTKEAVDTMCKQGHHRYDTFETFATLQPLLSAYNSLYKTTYRVGYTKDIPRQYYEYVSHYPRWWPSDLSSTANLVADSDGLSVSHLWRAMKTPDELARERILSVQEDVKQVQTALGQYAPVSVKGTMQDTVDASTIERKRGKWLKWLNTGKKYYEAKLKGALDDFTMSNQDLLALALTEAEEAKQKALVERLRKAMATNVFKSTTAP